MEKSKWQGVIPAPLCVAPWKAISVDADGIVRPDQIRALHDLRRGPGFS